MRYVFFLFVLVSTTLGCRASGYRAAMQEDSAEGYRRFLRAHPDDDDAPSAQARLAELEFEAAAKVHTVVAYKRFLEEFPEATEARAARARLEGLRFNTAKETGTAQALRQFISDHPDGAHRQEADRLLAEAELGEVSRIDDPARLARIAAELKDDPRSREAADRLDAQTFAAAKTAGAAKLLAYLRDFPAGGHRQEAMALLHGLRLEGLLFSGLLDEARAEAAQSPLSARVVGLEALFQHAEAAQRLGQANEPLARSAQAPHYLRALVDLEKALQAPDPLDRWQAAEELGQHVTLRAVDPLLDAFRRAPNPLVRQRAFESLGSVLRALPRGVADYEVAVRLDALHANAGDVEVHLAIAALLDLSGQLEVAAAEYQKAFDRSAPDPVILRRWAQIRRERRQFFSAAVAARQLASWAQEVAQAQTPSSPATALLPARQLCAAVNATRYALEVIAEARAQQTEFPEDLAAFEARARDAQKLAQARLADAELLLRTADRHARACDDRQVSERIAEGEKARAEALRAARKKLPKLAPALIELASQRDPSPAIRMLATSLLPLP
ncbi:MAG: HEAT repeat domain-containing protein [Myxococcota bacterium]